MLPERDVIIGPSRSREIIEEDVEAYWIQDTNGEAFSDGACRGDGFSSFARIVYATWPIGGQRSRFTVAFGYELLEGNHSSFVTELLGLERAVVTMLRLIEA